MAPLEAVRDGIRLPVKFPKREASPREKQYQLCKPSTGAKSYTQGDLSPGGRIHTALLLEKKGRSISSLGKVTFSDIALVETGDRELEYLYNELECTITANCTGSPVVRPGYKGKLPPYIMVQFRESTKGIECYDEQTAKAKAAQQPEQPDVSKPIKPDKPETKKPEYDVVSDLLGRAGKKSGKKTVPKAVKPGIKKGRHLTEEDLKQLQQQEEGKIE